MEFAKNLENHLQLIGTKEFKHQIGILAYIYFQLWDLVFRATFWETKNIFKSFCLS